MNNNYLKNEFNAEEDSFLLELRTQLNWNKSKFLKLINNMIEYCKSNKDAELLERWAVDGFWYTEHFVKEWTSNDEFIKNEPERYYELSYMILENMRALYFSRYEVYEDFDKMVAELRDLS
jgi:hypothetical protein